MAAGNLDDFLEDPNRLIMARKPCDEAKRAFGLNRPVHAVEGLVAVTTQSKSLVNLRPLHSRLHLRGLADCARLRPDRDCDEGGHPSLQGQDAPNLGLSRLSQGQH